MALRKFLQLSAVATALMIAGCGGDININTGSSDNGGNNGGGGTTNPPASKCPTFATEGSSLAGITLPVCEINGTITSNITLSSDKVWALSGKVVIGKDNAESATLTIQPGTKVFGKNGADYLVIARGSKIQAIGTATNPIVLTSVNDMLGLSDEESTGEWGGLVLLGKAPTNKCPDLTSCAVEAEGEAGPYGGNDPEDNSGALKYVQVKYAGYEVLPDNELNGITFAGVGRGTVVDYVQVHNNVDDGVEFFGGTVDLKHLVLTGNRDDSLDWADGWNGRVQHMLIRHNPNDTKANRGFEGDNQSGNFTATPISKPQIANVTIIGNNFDGDEDSEGILMRAGTSGELYNIIVTGPEKMGECFELNTTETANFANSGDLIFRNSIIDCKEPFANIKDSNGNVTFNAGDWFRAQPGNIVGDSLLGGYIPAPNSPALNNGYNVANNVDGWFDDVTYIGAFDGTNDWTKGWTYGLHPVEGSGLTQCPAGTTETASLTGRLNCQLTGDITSNITLQTGADYVLSGRVRVGLDNASSTTLTIQPGVTLYGKSGADFLVVSRGSKINANGTAANPIVMTSVQDVIGSPTAPGQWGGLVLLGNAPTNKCPDLNNCAVEAEGNAGPYGGPNAADSSGSLNYVVVKHAGYEVLPDNELNGITFAGVGSGTQCSNIQVHQNLDDGIEFFGGSMNCKNIVLTWNGDDNVDWTDGYNGKLQFVLVKQDPTNAKGNRGIEGDNQSTNYTATPVSKPVIANMTIIGNTFDGDDDSEGVLLRAGTSATLANFVITGPTGMGECLEIESNESRALADSGDLTMTHSVISCTEATKGTVSATTSTEQWFLNQLNNSIFKDGTAVVDGIFTINTTAAKDMKAVDSFFETTNFVGAVSQSNNWTAGWAVGLDK